MTPDEIQAAFQRDGARVAEWILRTAPDTHVALGIIGVAINHILATLPGDQRAAALANFFAAFNRDQT
jgi:hypothetical protein